MGTVRPMPANCQWLSTIEVAERLAIRPPTVYRLISAGSLKAHRIGRLIRIRVEDLDEYVRASEIIP